MRWHLPTKILGYIGAVSSVISIVALTIAIIALNSSVKQQTAQATRDSQQAAVIAAAEAARQSAHDSACRFYAFQIGPPGAPPTTTARGAFNIAQAKDAYRLEGCP
jgi:type II secretory pathway pseudopilin PulG